MFSELLWFHFRREVKLKLCRHPMFMIWKHGRRKMSNYSVRRKLFLSGLFWFPQRMQTPGLKSGLGNCQMLICVNNLARNFHISSLSSSSSHPNLLEKEEQPKKQSSPVEEKKRKDGAVQSEKKHLKVRFHILPEKAYKGRHIGAVRAMNEFGLRKEDLQNLKAHFRRSPYQGEPPTVLYKESDVREKAIQVHGSARALEKFQQKMKNLNRQRIGEEHEFVSEKRKSDPRLEGSFKVVRWAICANLTDMICKAFGWILTGSHSMFAEMVHSAADTLNQLMLAFGIKRSQKKPDKYHPYGYANYRHVTSLIAGMGILFCGTGFNFYHGISALLFLQPLDSVMPAFCALLISSCTQSITLYKGYRELYKRCLQTNMTFWEFIRSDEDPSLNVVLLEDSAALGGVMIAGGCLGLSALLVNPIPDAVGSLMIAGLLGGVASYIVKTNASHLVIRSIPQKEKEEMVQQLEKDSLIRSVHDVKATEMGLDAVRLKAEVDFDGRKLTETYLAHHDIAQILVEIQSLKTEDQLRSYLQHFGAGVVDMLGEEVDRIEQDLQKKHPNLRHVDLEVL